MSDKIKGFVGRSIAQLQRETFLRDFPARKGRFRYGSMGLNAPPGSVVLFQFQARIIASAIFLRDEKSQRPVAGARGRLHFDVESIRTFEPVDIMAMRAVWPGIRPFGHVKQLLNPAGYSKFKRRLRNVESPTASRISP